MKQVIVALSKYLTTSNLDNPCAFFKELSEILEERTSSLISTLFAIMCSAASQKFSKMPEDEFVDANIWLNVFNSAIKALER